VAKKIFQVTYDFFTFLKADIGPGFYWTPEDALTPAFPAETVQADELKEKAILGQPPSTLRGVTVE
jgi:hypothetical protein